MPLESLQYVIGVGGYRSVLKAHELSVRAHAARLSLTEVQAGEDWWRLSERLRLPVAHLRLHNPFLAARPLRAGSVVAYPPEPRADLFEAGSGSYTARLGDNYIKLAFTLGVDLELLRNANQLWRLEPLLPGTELTFPADPSVTFAEYTVRASETLAQVAASAIVDRWDLVRDNYLWTEEIREGMVLRIRRLRPPPPPGVRVHLVQTGDTLDELARRYDTTIRAIQGANALGRRTVVRTGQQLRIPE
jgi:LysM repeat protein